MIELGEHAIFIAAAYIGVFGGAAAMIGWTVIQSRKVSARLAELGDKRS
jgi:hypothetical protein